MAPRASLLVDGQLYGGWTELRVTRGMERLSADFEMSGPARWQGPDAAWPVTLFAPCQILLDEEPVFTGYVDKIAGALEGKNRVVRVAGRSRTSDLVDCSSLIEGGEFVRATFTAICRTICAPFGIEVDDAANVGGQVIPVDAIDPAETCFAFLERLARIVNVVLTDDARGRLVIARSSGRAASGSLKEGVNILRAETALDATRRHDRYVTKAQLPGWGSWQGLFDINGNEAVRPGTRPRPDIQAVFTDPDVPRYRPRVIEAEGLVEDAGALSRAIWQCRREIARGTELQVTVVGWRQKDGRLWTINEMIPVTIPSLGIEAELLISAVSYGLSISGGGITTLTLYPPDAFTPEPAGDLTRRRSAGRFEGIKRITSDGA